jgi:hypothetical protein
MFRFTIRELVLLTVIVAMGVGWWVDRSALVVGAGIDRLVADHLKVALQYEGFSVERTMNSLVVQRKASGSRYVFGLP